MNKFIGMGRLTADPEIRNAQSGTVVARYTLAVNRKYKREGEPEADFVPCVAFGKSAEFAEKYLSKGMQILVVGRLQISNYTDKDGNKRFKTDIIIDEQFFTGSKKSSNTDIQQSTEAKEGFYPISESMDDDDLPF